MQIQSYAIAGAILGCFASSQVMCQNLLNMEDSLQNVNGQTQKLLPSPTWKDTRLIDMQTTKTVAPGVMEFRIMHRFGNVGGDGNGGFHTLYGFDVASDIMFGFDFGITKNLQVGVQRSKDQELITTDAKYRFFTQQTSGMPISAALYAEASVTPEISSVLYEGDSLPQNFADRLSYFGEVIIDRRFNDRISLELTGGLCHRNFVFQYVNSSNGAYDENNIPFAGIGGRFMLTKHSGIDFDYYYIVSAYRTGNLSTPYHAPLSIGYEVETGGHVFEINFTNASFLDENNIIPYTRDNWLKGGFKLGFSISRVFNI